MKQTKAIFAFALLSCFAVADVASARERWRNAAAVTQRGAGNASSVVQTGNGNTAGVRQYGRDNAGAIVQTGDGNVACLIQVGRNLSGGIEQVGDNLSGGVLQTRRGVRDIPVEACAGGLTRGDYVAFVHEPPETPARVRQRLRGTP